ncbi:MAG: BatD family protein [Chitinophagaceae bacterium]
MAQDKSGISLISSVDRSRIVLGEPFMLSLELRYPEKSVMTSLPELPDSLAHFDVLEELKKDTSVSSGIYTIKYRYRLTSFDSGHWVIPSFTMAAGKKISKSDTLAIDVMTVPLQGNTYHDIRDIIEVDATPFDWKKWAAIAITAIILIAGIWYYLKNRKKTKPPPPEFDSKLSPLDQALHSLKILREENSVEKGEAKKFYSGLYDTMRIYLVRQYKLPVMSSTTGDVLVNLKGDYLANDDIARLAEVLRIADAVKFAKYPSSADEAMRAAEQMETIIRTLNTQKS